MWTNEVIRKGDKGELVSNVQKGLLVLGYDLGQADGIYGEQTFKAIQKFQKDHGLGTDGICGPITGKTLEKVYAAKTEADKAVAAKAAPAAAKGAPMKGAPEKGAPAKVDPLTKKPMK